MSNYPTCEICGKTLFPGPHAAKLARRNMRNRFRVYAAHGGFHVTSEVKIDKKSKRQLRESDKLY